jgi:predicted transposase YbfD/YdcC
LSSTFVSQTYKHFEKITDPRINRGANYPLMEMIFLTLCATISDANGWADVERYGKAKIDWLRKFFPFEFGIPSHDTLGRVFSRLDSVAFYSALQCWANDMAISIKGQTVAVDGKTLRGSYDTQSSQSAFHLITAWACGLRMCIAAKSVDSKSNEIPAVQQLIEQLDLKGAVVTADAMHCQKETAELIVKKEADYILQVKGNQPSLQTALNDAITQALEDDDTTTTRTHHKKEINRDRTEYRETVVMPCPKGNEIFASWKSIQTIGMTYRSRIINGKTEEFVSTFITSLPCKVRDIASRVRQHWGIENSQHYVLDVTFSEDSSRIRKGAGPEIASAFRRLALNILQQDTSMKDSIRGKRKRCAWDNSAIETLLASFSST